MNAEHKITSYVRTMTPAELAMRLVQAEQAIAQSPLRAIRDLAEQRTSRTERLHAAACMLLRELEHVEPGPLTVSGWTLARTVLADRSTAWLFYRTAAEGGCNLMIAPGPSLTGPYRGPNRSELVAFGVRAGAFVVELLDRAQRIDHELDEASGGVLEAAAALDRRSPANGTR